MTIVATREMKMSKNFMMISVLPVWKNISQCTKNRDAFAKKPCTYIGMCVCYEQCVSFKRVVLQVTLESSLSTVRIRKGQSRSLTFYCVEDGETSLREGLLYAIEEDLGLELDEGPSCSMILLC